MHPLPYPADWSPPRPSPHGPASGKDLRAFSRHDGYLLDRPGPDAHPRRAVCPGVPPPPPPPPPPPCPLHLSLLCPATAVVCRYKCLTYFIFGVLYIEFCFRLVLWCLSFARLTLTIRLSRSCIKVSLSGRHYRSRKQPSRWQRT